MNTTNNTLIIAKNEYKEIQRLRELWSNALIRWTQIFIPLSFAVVSIFLTLFPTFINEGGKIRYLVVLIIGGLLLIFFLYFWRQNCHRLDKEIAALYPRLLELEQSLGFELQSSYFFNHLSYPAKNVLASLIGKNCDELNEMDYRDFKESITNNPQEKLLEVWKKYKHNSVTSRGHDSHDNFAIILSIAYFLIVFFSWFYAFWQNNWKIIF